MAEKARYWVAVGYLENMYPDWESNIGDLVELPYAYCIHDLDHDSQSEHRKDHVHIILVFSNTTTKNHALSIFQRLSRPGSKAFPNCFPIGNIRHMYEYLIHNTETCRKKEKYIYPAENRHTGNNFDIGAYEQLSQDEIKEIKYQIAHFVIDNKISNYADLQIYAFNNWDTSICDVVGTYYGYFTALCKGLYLKSEDYKASIARNK